MKIRMTYKRKTGLGNKKLEVEFENISTILAQLEVYTFIVYNQPIEVYTIVETPND